MAPSANQNPDDLVLTRYLLGALPDKEAERLDELSITDEEFAWRLNAIENDLVDAYVRSELSQENLKQFKTFYLSSPQRRQKVQFAEGLMALERRAAPVPASGKAVPVSGPKEKPLHRVPWAMLGGPRFALPWGFAATSAALVILGGYLLFQNLQLRKQITQTQVERGSVEQRARELERRLNQERSAGDEARKELARAREAQTNLDQLKTVSVLLPPPMRGAAPIPTIHLRSGTDLVVLVLPLEADDFAAYRANLRDPVVKQVLWSSTRLMAAPGAERKTISVGFRAGLLKQQNYIVDLMGVSARGAAEVIAGYPFRVVLE